MVGIVKLALRRPYSFIVMAMLILIFGVASAFRTPTDIFPNIDIPVVSVVFSYAGLPPDDMAGRIVTFYERALTTSVNDVEHIESQSIPEYGIIKIFFQPIVNINAALAEVSAMSQTVLKQMPAGITPPTILSFNASSVPILQLALSSQQLSETVLFDQATSFIRPNWPRSPEPRSRCRMAAKSARSRPTSTSRRCTPTAFPQTTSSTPCRSKTSSPR